MAPPTLKTKQEAVTHGFDPDGENVLLCDGCYAMIMARWRIMQS